MNQAAPQLGDRVREIVTGREGVLTGYCEYLWGCEQFLLYVEGETDKDGEPKTVWYDVGRLEVVTQRAVEPVEHLFPEQPEPARPRARFWPLRARPRLAVSGPDVPAPTR